MSVSVDTVLQIKLKSAQLCASALYNAKGNQNVAVFVKSRASRDVQAYDDDGGVSDWSR